MKTSFFLSQIVEFIANVVNPIIILLFVVVYWVVGLYQYSNPTFWMFYLIPILKIDFPLLLAYPISLKLWTFSVWTPNDLEHQFAFL